MRLSAVLLACASAALAAHHDTRSRLCEEVSQIIPCLRTSERWEFDPHLGQCRPFRGCPGSGNNFNSQHSCQEMCHVQETTTEAETTSESTQVATESSVCQLPKLRGNCRALFQRYHFNAEKGECELFIYGGCNGNENNFQSKELCEATCGAQSTTEQSTTQVAEQESKCSLPALRGPCRGVILRWFYNAEHSRCEIFPFSGCEGNDNNFATLADCKAACDSQEEKPRMVCPASQPHARCAKDPCEGAVCPGEEKAICKADYCGGCFANFFNPAGEQVSCAAEVTTASSTKCDDFCSRAKCPACTLCAEHNGRCGCRHNPEDAVCQPSVSTTEAATTTAEPDLCTTAQCPPCTTCAVEDGFYGCYQNLTLPGCQVEDPCEKVQCGDCEICVPTPEPCHGSAHCAQYTCRAKPDCKRSEPQEEESSAEVPDARCPSVGDGDTCVNLRQCHYSKDCRGGALCCPTLCGTICHLP